MYSYINMTTKAEGNDPKKGNNEEEGGRDDKEEGG